MMKMRYTIIALSSFILASASVTASYKPNFSGKWVLDKDRSFSNPAGLDQTMTVTHTGDQVKMEAHLKTARGEFDVNETYTLDGKETDFTPQNPPNAKGKRKSSWLPNGLGILINDEISAEGKIVNQITRKWTLSADGKRLTVDYYIDDQRFSYESKRVFNKVE
ncbi:MAG: hypothetical protein L0226_05130 [Acidobacteria bacterium]|nr:hypothetical protein [Acidobacteriota bacterium]MCI0665640.1 hypothetical protein [Acidobacteriota bacterium]